MKILFIGESWHIHMIHSKGYDSFTSSKYEEGADYLLSRSAPAKYHYRLHGSAYCTNPLPADGRGT